MGRRDIRTPAHLDRPDEKFGLSLNLLSENGQASFERGRQVMSSLFHIPSNQAVSDAFGFVRLDGAHDYARSFAHYANPIWIHAESILLAEMEERLTRSKLPGSCLNTSSGEFGLLVEYPTSSFPNAAFDAREVRFRRRADHHRLVGQNRDPHGLPLRATQLKTYQLPTNLDGVLFQ